MKTKSFIEGEKDYGDDDSVKYDEDIYCIENIDDTVMSISDIVINEVH